MRLIDADSITYESIDSADLLKYEAEHGTGILAVRKEDIDAMHTAESQRIRGRWIPYSIVYENRNYCSECGYHLVGTSKYEANFCPNCGADMRGEQNEH